MKNIVMFDTERLQMRRWHESDAAALYKYASDSRVSEMALWPRHTSIDMSLQIISDFFKPNPNIFAMALKKTEEPIGCIGLVPKGEEHYQPMNDEREVGYWIGYPYWNKGLATEALNGLIRYCKNTLRLRSLIITTDTNNKASQHVALKCGFINIENYIYDNICSKAYRLYL